MIQDPTIGIGVTSKLNSGAQGCPKTQQGGPQCHPKVQLWGSELPQNPTVGLRIIPKLNPKLRVAPKPNIGAEGHPKTQQRGSVLPQNPTGGLRVTPSMGLGVLLLYPYATGAAQGPSPPHPLPQGEPPPPRQPDDQREPLHLLLAHADAPRLQHHGRADGDPHLPDNHRTLHPAVPLLFLPPPHPRPPQRCPSLPIGRRPPPRRRHPLCPRGDAAVAPQDPSAVAAVARPSAPPGPAPRGAALAVSRGGGGGREGKGGEGAKGWRRVGEMRGEKRGKKEKKQKAKGNNQPHRRARPGLGHSSPSPLPLWTMELGGGFPCLGWGVWSSALGFGLGLGALSRAHWGGDSRALDVPCDAIGCGATRPHCIRCGLVQPGVLLGGSHAVRWSSNVVCCASCSGVGQPGALPMGLKATQDLSDVIRRGAVFIQRGPVRVQLRCGALPVGSGVVQCSLNVVQRGPVLVQLVQRGPVCSLVQPRALPVGSNVSQRSTDVTHREF